MTILALAYCLLPASVPSAAAIRADRRGKKTMPIAVGKLCRFPQQLRTPLLLLAALGALLGSPGNAGEPVLTLAMAKRDTFHHHYLPENPPATTVESALPAPNSTEAFRVRIRSLAENRLTLSLPPEVMRAKIERWNTLVLTRPAPRNDSLLTLWAQARVQPGFGQIFYDRSASIYGRNGTGWQEPGCGYVKVCFRF